MSILADKKTLTAKIAIKMGHEKYITNSKGEIEFVALPIKEYERLVGLIEDYGLGLAIKEAEKDTLYGKEEALRYLENA